MSACPSPQIASAMLIKNCYKFFQVQNKEEKSVFTLALFDSPTLDSFLEASN